MRTVNGRNEWYTVKVEQNQDRAFLISSVMPELDARMEKINWKHAYYDPLEQNAEAESLEDRLLVRMIWKVVEDMEDLAQSGPEGMKRAMELENKYWKDTPMEGTVATFINESLNEHVMKATVNEENFEHLAKQHTYLGFGESGKDTLRASMEKAVQSGEKQFSHAYIPAFDPERAAVMLHYKQSDKSDLFFFNKFTVVVKNDKFPDGIKQGFDVQGYNRKNENITLKTAYNLTDGRYAMVTKQDKQKEEFSAWGKINFTTPKPNGDYPMQLFNKNYGFDLEKTVMQYPLKVLQTPEYKNDLLKSLEKGNLQLTTFQANGKEEKLYITPDIKMGSLKVYDQDKKLIPVQVLMEKQFINQEFGQQLVAHIETIKQKQEGQKQVIPKEESKVEKVTPKIDKPDKPPRQRQRNKLV